MVGPAQLLAVVAEGDQGPGRGLPGATAAHPLIPPCDAHTLGHPHGQGPGPETAIRTLVTGAVPGPCLHLDDY